MNGFVDHDDYDGYDGYDAALAGWATALRAGRTETWTQWLATAAQPGGGPRVVGSAAQLELVRRLALATPPHFEDLADLVLHTPAVGRGRLDVPLPWPGREHQYGAPPVAPELLPAGELLRVALGVLAGLLAHAPDPVRPHPASRGRWWRHHFRVHGAPLAAAAVRRRLLAAGWLPGDFRAVHLVVAEPLETGMQEDWSVRSRYGGAQAWPRLWRVAQASERLPARLDAAVIAGRLRDGVGPHRLHVLVARTPAQAADLAGQVLSLPTDQPPVDPPRVEQDQEHPALADLRRRLNPMLGRDGAARRAAVLDDWIGPGTPTALAAPAAQRAWAAATATRMGHDLAAGGYPVHGEPGLLAEPMPPGTPRGVPAAASLELAVTAIRAGWAAAQVGDAALTGQEAD